ncbi:alpha-1,6-mannosylglycoprotein 6-beta-N-acetylglucosaminyltransferase A-like [Glandiceps talaboti]
MKRQRYILTSRKMGIFLMFFSFLWIYTFTNYALFRDDGGQATKESERLKSEILDKSKQYVQALAQENSQGKISEGFSSYDLKKTMAVLLDSILLRLSKLEKKVDAAISNGTLGTSLRNISQNDNQNQSQSHNNSQPASIEDTKSEEKREMPVIPVKVDEKNKPMTARDLILEPNHVCHYKDSDLIGFVHCKGKIEWMNKYWETDPCYSHYGVDGTECAIAIYLSEIESWCPVLPWRKGAINNLLHDPTAVPAEIKTDKSGLYALMNDEKFKWIKMRIDRMWESKWVPAAKALASKQDLSNRMQKRILIHLGLLTKESGFKIAESAFSGGPLGELVQWSDIIAALYILGHDLKITTRTDVLKNYMRSKGVSNKNCPVSGVRPIDLIYIDIVGLKQFKKVAGPLWNQFNCMLRVIDSFGTEPAFNVDSYARKAGTKSVWGKWSLVPKQFMTMFPHTPDNSFMGFVVENYSNDTIPFKKEKNMAVVYGKKGDMWLGSRKYLDVIHEKFTLHATVYVNESGDLLAVPGYVVNHGLLKGDQVQELLRKAKLFVGLGFPFEGPAPLEAIANGCAFLNPSFNPPKNAKNTDFFKGKPTLRELSSQHPYAERYIGKPYVHTIDINDVAALRKTLTEIQENEDLKPHLPHEFTTEGMLQRLHAYIEHQNFCKRNVEKWPPLSALQVKIASYGESCKDLCVKHDLVCEPAFFKDLNSVESIEKEGKIHCRDGKAVDEIYPPSFTVDSACYLQNNNLLYSCAGGVKTQNRLCPCRDYIKGQIALCKDCV